MIADPRFGQQPGTFWACVRFVSQQVGYTVRGQGRVRVPTLADMARVLSAAELRHDYLRNSDDSPSDQACLLCDYFEYRASVLNDRVRQHLMDVDEARTLYERLVRDLSWTGPTPMNKQKGSKYTPAYLTAMVNMLIDANRGDAEVDFDPRRLTTVTRDGLPLRTFARRFDGAFPSLSSPVAVWEIKEYYHTTTFGSRVADGVYETMLDGMEIEELREHEGIDIKHYLMIDGRYTWWDCGKSYLCRIVDMLHMGLVDEVLVGSECVDRLPVLTREWGTALGARIEATGT